MTPSTGIKELRPLALGELIDRSATFWRAHIKPLFVLCFGFELVNYIFSKSVVVALERGNILFKGGPEVQARMEDDPTSILGDVGVMLLASIGLWLVLIWSYWLATLVVARYVVPLQLGEASRPADGLRRGLSRLGSFTGAYLLSQLWGLGISLLMMLPGGVLLGLGALLSATGSGSKASTAVGVLLVVGGMLLAFVGSMAALFWYFLRFALLAPVLAIEDLSTVGSFRRSGELIAGRVEPGFLGRVKVRAMILLTVVACILVAVSFISGLPAWIVRFSYGNPFDPAVAAANPIPQTVLVPVELLQVVGQSFFTPLALVFYAMFYLDMRMRREGLDLERRLDALGPATS